jgi:aspartyl-tRNA(Asn)/glutamyl-tRNA(Gln) amidotransferase subunit C
MLSREEVLKIAKLARLSLHPDEIEPVSKRLGRVLEHVNELKNLKTHPDAVVRHVPRDAVGFREDKAIPFTNVAAILKNAPEVEDGSISVPTVLEQ